MFNPPSDYRMQGEIRNREAVGEQQLLQHDVGAADAHDRPEARAAPQPSKSSSSSLPAFRDNLIGLDRKVKKKPPTKIKKQPTLSLVGEDRFCACRSRRRKTAQSMVSEPFGTHNCPKGMELQGVDNVPDTKVKCEEKQFVPIKPEAVKRELGDHDGKTSSSKISLRMLALTLCVLRFGCPRLMLSSRSSRCRVLVDVLSGRSLILSICWSFLSAIRRFSTRRYMPIFKRLFQSFGIGGWSFTANQISRR